MTEEARGEAGDARRVRDHCGRQAWRPLGAVPTAHGALRQWALCQMMQRDARGDQRRRNG